MPYFCPKGTRIAIRTKFQSWGTQLNVWDGVSVLDNRMTSSNKQSPAPGGSWDTLFLVSSSNYMLIEADQQAKAFNQGRRSSIFCALLGFLTIDIQALPSSIDSCLMPKLGPKLPRIISSPAALPQTKTSSAAA